MKPVKAWMWKAKALAPRYGWFLTRLDAKLYRPVERAGLGYTLVRVEIREVPRRPRVTRTA
jgi:hypothetical protein